MNESLRLATSAPIVRQAWRYGIGIGALLIVINHGDALFRRELSIGRVLRMALTGAVPYAVSTASSVSALRERSPVDHLTKVSSQRPRQPARSAGL